MNKWMTKKEFERNHQAELCWVAIDGGIVNLVNYYEGSYIGSHRRLETRFIKAVMPIKKPDYPTELNN